MADYPWLGSGVNLNGLDPTLWQATQSLFGAMPPDVANAGTRIVSGYRTPAEQAVLYAKYKAGTGGLAAPAGRSQHNFGRAMDVYDPTGWVHKNAGQYGLGFPVRGDYPHMQYVGGATAGNKPMQYTADPQAFNLGYGPILGGNYGSLPATTGGNGGGAQPTQNDPIINLINQMIAERQQAAQNPRGGGILGPILMTALASAASRIPGPAGGLAAGLAGGLAGAMKRRGQRGDEQFHTQGEQLALMLKRQQYEAELAAAQQGKYGEYAGQPAYFPPGGAAPQHVQGWDKPQAPTTKDINGQTYEWGPNGWQLPQLPGQAAGAPLDVEKQGKFQTQFEKNIAVPQYQYAAPIYQSMLESAKGAGGASDQDLMAGIGQLMRPNSMRMGSNGWEPIDLSSMPEQFQTWWNNFKGNKEQLPKSVRSAIMREAYIRMKAYRDAYATHQQKWSKAISQAGLDPELIAPTAPEITEMKPEDIGGGVEAAAAPQATTQGGPRVGEVQDGYRFKGGNPGDPNNWEKVQ